MRSAHLFGSVLVLMLLAPTVMFADELIEEALVTPDQILIQYERNMSAVEFDAFCSRLSELGFGFIRHYPRSCVLKVQVPFGDDSKSAVAKAKGVSGVHHSEIPFTCHACGEPNDEWYWLQWNLRHIGYEQAWDLFLKDAAFADPAIIAVLDTGIAYEDHADSMSVYQYERAPDFGEIVFVDGYDAVNDDYRPNDDNGHGTHVCGVIAQSTNNIEGVASIAFGCKIMPVKVLGEYQTGDTASLTEGIYYAVDNGADVLNISLGFSWYFSRSSILAEAVAYAADNGVVMVGSSGNEYLPYVKFPAAYNECLAVGACLFDDDPGDVSRAPYSNYGVALDLIAPGGDFGDRDDDLYPEAILAESFDGGAPSGCWDLWWAPGTSPAAGQVSGIAGVLVSLGLDREEVMAVLKGTASKVGWDPDDGDPAAIDEFDCETGYGLVDVHRALDCALTGLIPRFPEYTASISLTIKKGKGEKDKGGECHAEAKVTVTLKTDRGQEPAKRVTVYGYWQGSVVGADSEETDKKGKCKFKSEKTAEENPHFEFVITNVVKDGRKFSTTAELPLSDVAEADAMIVRPLRSTGGACASVVYTPWFMSPTEGIY